MPFQVLAAAVSSIWWFLVQTKLTFPPVFVPVMRVGLGGCGGGAYSEVVSGAFDDGTTLEKAVQVQLSSPG
jgi:hypothetical protein